MAMSIPKITHQTWKTDVIPEAFPLRVCLTVDVEPDCPPYLNTFRGIEHGMGPLLELLETEKIKATFFMAGEVAEKYPDTVYEVVSRGHELGSHGLSHRDFSLMDSGTAMEEIKGSMELLSRFAPVISFRAPYLRFPDEYLHLLKQSGFLLDSSLAKYKLAYYAGSGTSPVRRIPVSATSSILRLPDLIRVPYLRHLSDPVVLFVHPWEFIDLRREKLRLDCRFKTGQGALDSLQWVISFFRKKRACFRRISDLL